MLGRELVPQTSNGFFDSSHTRRPFGMLADMDKILESFWGPTVVTSGTKRPAHTHHLPRVEAKETEDSYIVMAEIPGVKKKDLEIDFDPETQVLRLAANTKEEKKKDKSEDDDGFFLSRRFASFERRFTLPGDVDTDKSTAELEDGILTLTLAKKEPEAKVLKSIKLK